MKLVAALVLSLSAGAVWAHGCPGEMRAVDARMPAAKLDAAQMTRVKDLRAQGERLHQEGKHTESMAALAEAKKLLGQ